MSKYELSILIPARNEEFLAKTVEDLLQNIRGDTEIIVGLDGQWANPPLTIDPRVTVLYVGESIGQRAMMNQLCRLSQAKYVMKIDAHCAFDEGFDIKMIAKMQDDYTMVPIMKNLHAFDWVCIKCRHRDYQGPRPDSCVACGGTDFNKDVVWIAKPSPNSTSYRFDRDLHFQYFGQFKSRPEYQKQLEESGLTETMSLQGSCFMLTRDKYWQLNIADEAHGSWGQQGVEVACKTWLSGGRVVCNHDTWYAHMFRTQNGFSFPYPNNSVKQAREYSKSLWESPLCELKKKWSPAIRELPWLLAHFHPVPDWTDVEFKVSSARKPTKGVVYYSDNNIDQNILDAVQKQITKGIKEKHIISVTLKPTQFGHNIHLPLERGYLTMAKQILVGLEASTADVIFLCEHDVLYDPSHFDFIPPKNDIFYYNTNVWKVRLDDGHAIRTDDMRQLSGLCARRELLLEHFRQRVQILENKLRELGEGENFNRFVRQMGFEPGTHGRKERVDDRKSEKWEARLPNLDIRHGNTLTADRWSPEQFRNQRFAEGWSEADTIEPWGNLKEYLNANIINRS